MDFVFWIPWALSVAVFVMWVKQPISEFVQIWKSQQRACKNREN